jgi:hypothetical protein
MTKSIFSSLCFILLLSTASAQEANLDLLRKGAYILGQQFHTKNLSHKAKVMAKLLAIIDKDNQNTRSLIDSIKNSTPITTTENLKDNGIQYAQYFHKNGLQILEPFNLEQKQKQDIITIVCTTLDSQSPAQKDLRNASITAQFFYRDIFKINGILSQRNKALEIYKKATLPPFSYCPAEFLKGISTINSFLALTKVQLKLDMEQLGRTKFQIDNVDESKGYTIYKGPPIEGASQDDIVMNKTSLKDFLRYIDHTTRLTPQLNPLDNSIELREAKKGQKGRPLFLKSTAKLYKEIQLNRDSSKIKYNSKFMQIRGKVTKIKDAGTKYYIELDNVYILEINKTRFKKDSPKNIQKEFDKNQKNLKEFIIVARGFCQIGSKSIYIKDCKTILSEKMAFFYTD